VTGSVAAGTASTLTYGYDTEHTRLTSVGSANLTNDASGNLLSDGTNTYTWTPTNQLSTVVTPSGTATFTFDALGRMASMTPPEGSEGILHYLGTSTIPAEETDAHDRLVPRATVPQNESDEDTYRDILNYALIAPMVRHPWWNLPFDPADQSFSRPIQE